MRAGFHEWLRPRMRVMIIEVASQIIKRPLVAALRAQCARAHGRAGKSRISDDGKTCVKGCGGSFVFNDFLDECISCAREPNTWVDAKKNCKKVSGACADGTFESKPPTST